MILMSPFRVLSALVSPMRQPKTVNPPPSPPPPPKEDGNFHIKVTTYETNPASERIKRYTGYSQDSEIIPKTMEYCISQAGGENMCQRPVVSTCTGNTFTNCVVVDNLVTKSTHVHWISNM